MRWFDSERALDDVTEGDVPTPPLLSPPRLDRGTNGDFELIAPSGLSVEEAAALGPLLSHLRPGVTDLLLNGGRELWTDEGRGLHRHPDWQEISEESCRELAATLIEAGGRHLDHSSPCVDVRLDRLRVHAAIPPVSVNGTSISVRVAPDTRWTLSSLVEAGMFDDRQRAALSRLVADRANLLVTGSAGAGKTTLLAALLADVPHEQRIITIEDVAELRIAHPHVVALEARQANIEGVGALELSRLLVESLRMRPDRLVVGECRGAEIRELLMALATGHDGGAGTLHARSLAEVPARLEALGMLAGLDVHALARLAVSAIDVLIHVVRVNGVRRIEAMGRLALDHRERLVISPLAE